MADKEENSSEGKSGGGLLPIINLVLLVLVLGVGGFIAWKLITMDQPQSQSVATTQATTDATTLPAADNESSESDIQIPLDNITANLADEEQRFLNADITLVVRNDEGEAKIKDHMNQVLDLINTTLRTKKFDDIRSESGTMQLKEQLRIRINALVGGKPVKNVLFTKFVSQ